MKNNGLAILQAYCEEKIIMQCGGWCELHTYIVTLDEMPSKEDRDILEGIGWSTIGWSTGLKDKLMWKFEEWN